jgi:hypothetical protein
MIRIALFIVATLSLMALSGCGVRETMAEVEFEKAKFGLEYIPDRSLEGYNEKYHPFFQPPGSPGKKYFLKPDDGFQFGNFPKNPSLLEGFEVVVVDTMARTYEKYDRTVALSTLYVDPDVIDPASWQTLSRFVSESYSKPDSANKLIQWLNHGYNVAENPDTLYIFETIYALVYTNIAALEPEYARADSKRLLKVGVDDAIYFKDETEPAPAWLYTGRLGDSVFYFWPGRAELLTEFGEYERNGVKFKTRYRQSQSE